MEETLKVKLNKNYSNPFVTTLKGYAFYKDKYTDYHSDDKEVDNLLNQGILIVKDEVDNMPEEISEAPVEEEKVEETPTEEVEEKVEEAPAEVEEEKVEEAPAEESEAKEEETEAEEDTEEASDEEAKEEESEAEEKKEE